MKTMSILILFLIANLMFLAFDTGNWINALAAGWLARDIFGRIVRS